MYVPRAIYSLRMSFWIVPRSWRGFYALAPGDSDIHCQQDRCRSVDGHAGGDFTEGDLLEQGLPCHPAKIWIRPLCPPRPAPWDRRRRTRSGWARSKATDKPGLAMFEQVAVAAVRLLGAGVSRILAHGPETAAIHGRLDAAGDTDIRRGIPASRRNPGPGRRETSRRGRGMFEEISNSALRSGERSKAG